MKQKLFTLFLVLVANIGTLFAESGTCGANLTWNLTDSVLTISGTGDMNNYSSSNRAPWLSPPSLRTAIKEVFISNGVTGIGDHAFRYCTSLTSITIPNSVTSIGNYAFLGCSALAYVDIPDNITRIESWTFYGCSSLTSITIPGSVTSIGSYAFGSCSSLTSVAIPNSVTSIGSYAFQSCSSLTSVAIPNTVTSIEDRVFSNCNNLTSVNIPNSVTSIGGSAFYGCSSLTSVAIPNSVTSIGSYAFQSCSSLTSVAIPNTVTSIGGGAFYGCSSLTSVAIPNSVTSIGNNAFSNCTDLTSISVDVDNLVYDSRENCNAIIETATNTLIVGDKNTIIPNSVTSIGEGAFRGRHGLTSITIPNRVTSIGDYAFFDCTDLMSVTISCSVTNIGDNAFSGCDNITSVIWNAKNCNSYNFGSQITSFVFGDSVEIIPASLCSGMGNLTAITIPNSVTSIGEGTFIGCNNLINVTINSQFIVGTTYSSSNSLKDIFGSQVLEYILGDITSIGNHAFSNCNNLTSVTIPRSITSIGEESFSNCTGLTSIAIPINVANIGDNAFSGCDNITSVIWNAKNCNSYNFGSQITSFVFGDSVEIIPASLCSGMGNLTSVTIPNSVKSIGENCFKNCTGLSSIELPNSVIDIGNEAFGGCLNVQHPIYNAQIFAFLPPSFVGEYTLSNGIKHIIGGAFSNCSGITSLTIPNSLISIEVGAFRKCSGLTTVVIYSDSILNDSKFNADHGLKEIFGDQVTHYTIGEGVTSIGHFAFQNCTGLTSVEINNSVTSIGGGAFKGCTGLTSVTLPKNLKNIYSSSFQGCKSLTSIAIPDSVTSIGAFAFSGCTNMSSVVIGRNVSKIETGAFSGCTSLTTVKCCGKSPAILDVHGYHIFQETASDLKIFVPCGTQEVYKTYWSAYAKNVCYAPDAHCLTVTFVDWDGSILKVQDVAPGESAIAPDAPSRDKYTFTGWDKEYNNVTHDMTVSALYEKNTYIVTFVDWDGRVLKTGNVEEGSSATEPVCPKRDGYYFIGWDLDYSNVISNLTITAQYFHPTETPSYRHIQIGDLYFNLFADATAEVTYLDGTSPNVGRRTDVFAANIPAVVRVNENSYVVTRIGEQAFISCYGLTTVTIPYSVVSIDEAAFQMSGINSIEIPNSVTNIGIQAFFGCHSLTSVTIPNSVTSMGYSAFHYCTRLTSIAIPNSVTCVGNGAFSDCKGLTHVDIPDNITCIGSHAFNKCTGLSSIKLPNSLISIETGTFFGCSGLTSITIPDSVKSIGDNAFSGCSGLTSITLPDSVTSIGDNAFYGCTGLMSITIPSSVTSIGNEAFAKCSKLTSINIPNSVTSIGNKAFSSCSNLRAITVATDNLNYSSSDYILYNKDHTELIKCPEKDLFTVTIPGSVMSIEDDACRSSVGLASITCLALDTPMLKGYPFEQADESIPLYVPKESLLKYKKANVWKNFNIFGIDSTDSQTINTAITVRLNPKSCSSWSTVRLWAWTAEGNLFDFWPGIVVNKDSDGWYSYTFDENIHVVNIIWTDGTNQTKDITNITSSTCYSLKTTSGSTIDAIAISSCAPENVSKYYVVTFTNWNDSVLSETLILKGDSATAPSIPPREGYVFIGWDKRFNNITSDLTIKAQYEEGYMVTFEDWDGSVLKTEIVKYGLSAIAPENPTRDGYVFIGWNNDFSSISTTLTVIALYRKTFTITFVNWDGNQLQKINNVEEGTIPVYSGPSPTRPYDISYNYKFRGWTPEISAATKDETYIATFDSIIPQQITVRLNPESCSQWSTVRLYAWIVSNNEDFALNAPWPGIIVNRDAEGWFSYTFHPGIRLVNIRWNDGSTQTVDIVDISESTCYELQRPEVPYFNIKVNVVDCQRSYYMVKFIDWNGSVLQTYDFLDKGASVTPPANPSRYGYTFVGWDKDFSNIQSHLNIYAQYMANPVITYMYDSEKGLVQGETTTSADVLADSVTFEAIANYGYHFVQWSDGVTDNPRTIWLSQDTTFTAEFAVDKSGTCGTNLALKWEYDDDSKTLIISGKGALEANYTFGAEAPSQAEKLILRRDISSVGNNAFNNCVALKAIEWNVPSCTNFSSSEKAPFVKTKAKISTFVFGKSVRHIPAYLCYGMTKLTKISLQTTIQSIGQYAFANINNREIKELVLPTDLTTIGSYAFSENTYVESIDFGPNVQSIGSYAFKGCSRVYTMTCLAETTPDVGTNALTDISSSAELCVLGSCIQKYKVDSNWGRFALCELGTTGTTSTGEIEVEPGDNTASFTWPTNSNAASYTLIIMQDGIVICTLIFNENGLLVSIAFAPGKDGNANAPAALKTASGMQFTVTGLDTATAYSYRLIIKSKSGSVLANYSGTFGTNGAPQGFDSVKSTMNITKILRNGQILILRGDKIYTVQGQEVK